MKPETEVRSKNTPAITAYRHMRDMKDERNENLRDFNFKVLVQQKKLNCGLNWIFPHFKLVLKFDAI